MRKVSKDLFQKATAYIEEAANFTRTTIDYDGNKSWWVSTETTDKKVAELVLPDQPGWSSMYLIHEKVYQAVAYSIDV